MSDTKLESKNNADIKIDRNDNQNINRLKSIKEFQEFKLNFNSEQKSCVKNLNL